MRPAVETLAWAAVGAVIVASVIFAPLAVVGGESMRPTLVRGDVCLTVHGLDVREGDIVLYRRPGESSVLHRVIGIETDGTLRTRGDANRCDDRDPVAPDSVRGRVVAVFPLGRAMLGWMRCTGGATLLTQSR